MSDGKNSEKSSTTEQSSPGSSRPMSGLTSSDNETRSSKSSSGSNSTESEESTEMPPLVKEHLKDKFKLALVFFVCKGSTCSLFKMVDSKGAFFAAKVLEHGKLSAMVLNNLLPNELSIVREVRHQYIMRVDSVFSLPGYSVILSEFASDGDLISYIERVKKPDIAQSKQWFAQVLQALVYLHTKGIAHRDIKADNVLLCGEMGAKLGDFGYATRCLDTKGTVILSTNFCGTLEYKAPEAIKCVKPYNAMIADCFSMGVLLYVMVTHEFPFGSGAEIRTISGLNTHYEEVTSKKWRPTGAITTDKKLYYLLCQLLNPDVKERISAKQALVHPWIASDH